MLWVFIKISLPRKAVVTNAHNIHFMEKDGKLSLIPFYFSCSTESELVMDLERMKQDDRKKKKQTKVISPEVEQVRQLLQFQ